MRTYKRGIKIAIQATQEQAKAFKQIEDVLGEQVVAQYFKQALRQLAQQANLAFPGDYPDLNTYDLSCLTDRQREVIELRAQGLQQSQIAALLGVSRTAISMTEAMAWRRLNNLTVRKVDERVKNWQENYPDLSSYDLNRLTRQQRKVVLMRSKGLTQEEIARRLKVSQPYIALVESWAWRKLSKQKK